MWLTDAIMCKNDSAPLLTLGQFALLQFISISYSSLRKIKKISIGSNISLVESGKFISIPACKVGLLELCNSSKLAFWCLNPAKSDRKAQIQAPERLNADRYTCGCGKGGLEGDIFISPSSTQLPKYTIGFWVQSVNMSTSKGFTVHRRGRWTPWLSVPLPLSLSLSLSLSPPRDTHTNPRTHIFTFWVRAMCFGCRVAIMHLIWGNVSLSVLEQSGMLAGSYIAGPAALIHSTLSKDRKSSLHQWHSQSISQPFQVLVSLSANPSVMYHHSLSPYIVHTHTCTVYNEQKGFLMAAIFSRMYHVGLVISFPR